MSKLYTLYCKIQFHVISSRNACNTERLCRISIQTRQLQVEAVKMNNAYCIRNPNAIYFIECQSNTTKYITGAQLHKPNQLYHLLHCSLAPKQCKVKTVQLKAKFVVKVTVSSLKKLRRELAKKKKSTEN